MILIPEENKCLPTLVIVKRAYYHKVLQLLHKYHTQLEALALKWIKPNIATATVGEGSNQGDFHEGLNFAGVHKLPFVCVIINNKYAISVPNTLQYAQKNFLIEP